MSHSLSSLAFLTLAGCCVSAAYLGCATNEDLTVAPSPDAGKDTGAVDASGDSAVPPVDSSKADGTTDGPTDAPTEVADAPADIPCDKSLCGALCVDTMTDPENCGSCKTKCAAGQYCIAGKCASCDAPSKKCGALCIDTSSDPANCGDCGKVCGGGKKCVKSTCTCDTGAYDCSGTCVDIFNDKDNCGSCGKKCATGETCVLASCEKPCLPPSTKCGSCVDTSTDINNCGACGKVCGTGEACVKGVCGCGGKTCGPLEACVSGACVCKSPLKLCGTTCLDVSSDPGNCGACGKTCSAPTGTCVSGVCSGVAKCNSGPPKVLMYSPLGTGNKAYLPTGATVVTVDATGWAALSETDFASYQLIVLGDEGYSAGSSAWDPIAASKSKWFPAIGRVLVHTLDPVAHGISGATTFSTGSLKWAATGPKTGLWVGPDYGDRKLDFLSSFGAWTVLGQKTDGTAGDDVTVNISSHGSMTGSSSSSLSSWGYSYHGAISGFPAGFDKVAAVTASGHGIVVAKDVACAP